MFIVLVYFVLLTVVFFFFFKQKTAYEMRISDWSSDVCSSDLPEFEAPHGPLVPTLYTLAAQQHMHEYGTTFEQMAEVAVAMRAHAARNPLAHKREIGKESCRERVCQSVSISVCAESLKKKRKTYVQKKEVASIYQRNRN